MRRFFTTSTAAELYFWLGIMRDHTRFLLVNLAPVERQLLQEVREFRRSYLELFAAARAHQQGSDTRVPDRALANRSQEVTARFVRFQEEVLGRQLRCEVTINQPPTFTQHMINEAEEFLDVLTGSRPTSRPQALLEQHLLWLPDAWGHAAFLAAALDPRESQLVRTAREYQHLFEQFHLKAEELDTILGPEPAAEAVLERFTGEVADQIQAFQRYLFHLRSEVRACRLLTFMSPLVPDHMAREEQYYLEKISVST